MGSDRCLGFLQSWRLSEPLVVASRQLLAERECFIGRFDFLFRLDQCHNSSQRHTRNREDECGPAEIAEERVEKRRCCRLIDIRIESTQVPPPNDSKRYQHHDHDDSKTKKGMERGVPTVGGNQKVEQQTEQSEQWENDRKIIQYLERFLNSARSSDWKRTMVKPMSWRGVDSSGSIPRSANDSLI